MASVRELLSGACTRLAKAGSDTAELDAQILLAHTLSKDRIHIVSNPVMVVSDVHEHTFLSLVERRATLEPIAYIIGYKDFWEHRFKVNQHTLIPRPDTETLVDHTLNNTLEDQPKNIIDLGTGSGCILLSLLHELPGAEGVGVDVSPDALMVANENADSLGMADRVTFVESNWFSDVFVPEGGFDIIVANPPYIAPEEMEGLMTDVRGFEPRVALCDEVDGLSVYRYLSDECSNYLSENGFIAFEVGEGQAEAVAGFLEEASLHSIKIAHDLGSIARVVSAKK